MGEVHTLSQNWTPPRFFVKKFLAQQAKHEVKLAAERAWRAPQLSFHVIGVRDDVFLVTVNGSTSGSDGLTLEFTGPRRWAKPAVVGPVERRVGRHPWAMSRPVILHERDNLHELDARAHTVETGHPLE